MKKPAVDVFLALCLVLTLCACSGDKNEEHVHTFSQWETAKEAACEKNGAVIRQCTLCGKTESKAVDMLGHTFVETQAKEATCTQAGYTSRILCSRCGKVKQSSSPIAKKPHTPRAVPAVAATCTQAGYTEGEECSVCNQILKSRTAIAKLGHSYSSKVTKEPSCTQTGTKTYTCSRCGDSKTETLSLKKYTAQELYNLTYSSICEVHSYNSKDDWIGVGSGFVFSRDGLILTAYSVIEKAYSARVFVDNKYYDVLGLVAYDKDKELAVLAIDAQDLKPLYVCTKNMPKDSRVYAMGTAASIEDFVYLGDVSLPQITILGTSYIKHDATVTKHNVGGPLVNEYGEVVGINTMEYQKSGELNLSVHASELLKLNAGKLIKLSDLNYPSAVNYYKLLTDWLLSTGTDQNGYIGNWYKNSSNGKTLGILYSRETGLITLVSAGFEGNQEFYCSLTLSSNSTANSYLFNTKPENRPVRQIEGRLYPWQLSQYANLPFTTTNCDDVASYEASSMAAKEMTYMLQTFDTLMQSCNLNIRAANFGFNAIYK